MRCYFFGNMYLSPIQQGIQAGHTIAEMSVKYRDDGFSQYFDWAEHHKTVILLNGGMSSNLQSIINHFEMKENPYDWDFFVESQDALDGALTCVGIVLPESVYTNATFLRENSKYDLLGIDEWEMKLYSIINSCRLA